MPERKIKVTKAVRVEIEHLCADVLRIRERWMFIRDNERNESVDNAQILDAHGAARALTSKIQSTAHRIASLAMGENPGGTHV